MQVILRVSGIASFRSVLIPHFHRYPLLAKKRRDFDIWERGIAVMARVRARPRRRRGYNLGTFPKWTEDDRREFDGLVELLKETRRFEGGGPVSWTGLAGHSTGRVCSSARVMRSESGTQIGGSPSPIDNF